YIPHKHIPLLKHQPAAVLNIVESTAYALFMEQGTCKTSTVIAATMLEAARKRAGKLPGRTPTMYRLLVSCPNQVRTNWALEFEKFATVPGKVVIVKGDHPVRIRQILDGVRDEPDCVWSVCIIGHDT